LGANHPPHPFFFLIKMARTELSDNQKDRVLYRALTDMEAVYLYPKDLVKRIKREAAKFEPGPTPHLLGCYEILYCDEVLDQKELIEDRIQETLFEYCQRYIYTTNK
jgi:hypothetical protein